MVDEQFFKTLKPEEEQDFRAFVDEDAETKAFIKKAIFWHPVIRNEICKRLKI